MKNTAAVALFLGLASSVDAREVQCPFGHKHHVDHHHHHHHHNETEGADEHHHHHHHESGILHMLKPIKVQFVDQYQALGDGEDLTYHPIKKWFEKKKLHYKWYEEAKKDADVTVDFDSHHMQKHFNKMMSSKHECPFMKYFSEHGHHKAEEEQTPLPPVQNNTSPFFNYEKAEPQDPTEIDPMIEGSGVPTAIFHGLGDACINPGMMHFSTMVQKGTSGKTHCIEVGAPSIGEIFNNFETIAKKSCQEIASNPDFAGEFNVVGLSQGGLLARYMVEECEMPGKVRNMLSIGGPHMGVDAVPRCTSGFMCDIVNKIASKLVYTSFAQNWLAPAGYFRDVRHLDKYEKKSVFLPYLNNEHATKGSESQIKKGKLEQLNEAMFVMFESDTVMYPKETAWFQTLDNEGKDLLPLNGTDFYNQDFVGLKNLTDEGKAHYISVQGDHLQFTEDDMQNIFVPFLNQ